MDCAEQLIQDGHVPAMTRKCLICFPRLWCFKAKSCIQYCVSSRAPAGLGANGTCVDRTLRVRSMLIHL